MLYLQGSITFCCCYLQFLYKHPLQSPTVESGRVGQNFVTAGEAEQAVPLLSPSQPRQGKGPSDLPCPGTQRQRLLISNHGNRGDKRTFSF